MTAVEPPIGQAGRERHRYRRRPGQVKLDKSKVVAVFGSDARSDYNVKVLEQTPEKIVFMVPSVKPASYNVSVQVRNEIHIQPVRFNVE